jgi:hypothetical protein
LIFLFACDQTCHIAGKHFSHQSQWLHATLFWEIQMIKPLTGVELSSSKVRSGMSSVSELIPRLIRSYELQAELVQRRTQSSQPKPEPTLSPAPIPPIDMECAPSTQATFGWF